MSTAPFYSARASSSSLVAFLTLPCQLVAQGTDAYVKDSMRFISIFLHVACSNVIQ